MKILRRCNQIQICCLVFLCFLQLVSPVLAEQRQYQEQKGKEVTTVLVTREKEGRFVRTEMVRNDITEICFNEIGGIGATSRWQREASLDSSYEASRKLNILTITGKTKGVPHENGAGLDDKPWLQDLGYSLEKFAKTSYRDLAFWTIREGELEPAVLEARKRGAETILLNGQSVATQKIEVRSNDFFKKLWSAFYWIRESDGELVQYRSDPGIPGTSAIVGTLVPEQAPAPRQQ